MKDVPEMQYRTLGRTGLRVSRIGLGAGGPSLLGLARGSDAAGTERVIKQAVDLGINIIDTSPSYGTEQHIGPALRSVTEPVYVATKIRCHKESGHRDQAPITDPQHVFASVERSLGALHRDVIDILQLHGIPAAQVDRLIETLVPAMQRLQEQGKVRFLGLSEFAIGDTKHDAAVPVCASGVFDTLMLHYGILNQEAERRAFRLTRENNIGVFCMSPVRNAFRSPQDLQNVLDQLFPGKDVSLEFLLQGSVRSYADAAYKFAAAQENIHTILVGTGNPQHLIENTRAILGDPLPQEHMKSLKQEFGHVDGTVMFTYKL